MHLKKIISTVLITALATSSFAKPFAEREDTKSFIDEMVKKHNFNKTTLTNYFNNYDSSNRVLELIAKPAEGLEWDKYRKLFINKSVIDNGVVFYKKHQKELKFAEKKFGVSPEIIVAILGVETRYGKNSGNIPVLQSLATLAFDYPPRAKFFRSELEQFLLLTKENNLDPVKVKGSYAGAMGSPQFIPSSYRHYAANLSHKGPVDLFNNTDSAIGSVANYFAKHGWQKDESVAHIAKVNQKAELPQKASYSNPKPNLTIQELKKAGISPKDRVLFKPNTKVAFLELKHPKDTKAKEYWIARDNFYVITRYNRSVNYAMAVYQLSQEIKSKI